MIMNVRFRPGQTNGLRIGDEMNLVAPASEFKAEFGGDNSAAAVGWITGDANLHAAPDSSPTISSLDSPEGPGMQDGRSNVPRGSDFSHNEAGDESTIHTSQRNGENPTFSFPYDHGCRPATAPRTRGSHCRVLSARRANFGVWPGPMGEESPPRAPPGR